MTIFNPLEGLKKTEYIPGIKYYKLNNQNTPQIVQSSNKFSKALFHANPDTQELTLSLSIKKSVCDKTQKNFLFHLDDIQSKIACFFTTKVGRSYLKENFSISSYDKLKVRALIDETPNRYNSFIYPTAGAEPTEIHTISDNLSSKKDDLPLNKVHFNAFKNRSSNFMPDRCYIELTVREGQKLQHLKVKLCPMLID